MGSHTVIHPPADELRACGVGLLDDASAEGVAKHLETCADCRGRAGQSEDDFLRRLRDSVRSGDTSVPHGPAEGLAPLPGCPHHDVLRELGRGGMGTVYLAWNRLMGRREVLKVMHEKLLDRPGAKARFLREIQTAAGLRDPHVVTAYSVLSAGDDLVLAMEYVEGETLDERVQRGGPLPVAEACDYVRQAALGLQHAFEKGMVHRDVKPQNLILSQEGDKAVVKVLDFGLAKATSEKAPDQALTADGALLGTPEYVAPEQIRDPAAADVRADIYGLGCTLYFLLTGRPPFRGKSVYETLQEHESAEATPLDRARPDVPAAVAVVAARMMAKDPARRFQTPAEAAAALAPFASAMPAKAKPAPGRKSRVLIGAAVCVVLMGLVGLWCGRALRVQPADDYGPPPAAADDHGPPPDQADAFTPLFNGRDLTGWSIEGPKTTTLSLAGAALAPDNHGPPGFVDHLLTRRSDYVDFHFRCRFLLKDPADAASVLVRVDPSPIVFGGMRGYEVSIPGSGPASLALSSRVRENCVLADAPHDALAADAWQALDVVAVGDRIRVLVNGMPALDHRDEGRAFPCGALALVFRPKSTCRFRDLEIQELKPESAPPPAGDGRSRWVHKAIAGNEWNERWGVFQQAEGKRWVESVTNVPKFLRFAYTEVNRTDDYVELDGPDGRKENRIRLYDDHADIGPPGGELHHLYTGGWEK